MKQFVLAAILIASYQLCVQAQSLPPLINYQGRLTDAAGVTLPDGVYKVAFRLWNDPTASSTNAPSHLIWGREYALSLYQGTFNLILGAEGSASVAGAAVNDLNFAFTEPNRYLGLTLVQTPSGAIAPNQQREIVPRQQLLSVPFAIQAQQAQEAQVASALITNSANILSPPGVVAAYMGASAPRGWLLCDGTAVSRTLYAALFNAIGTSAGAGDGATTFNLPDLRGMFLRGANGSQSNTNFLDPDAALRTNMFTGGNAGNQVGSVQIDALKRHAHTYTTLARNYGVGGGGSGNPGSEIPTSLTGEAGTSTETRPKNVYVNYIIKY